MFHVKHNNKDNILHVHIGDRTRRRAQAQAGAGRTPAGRDTPAAAAIPATRACSTSGGQVGDRQAFYIVLFSFYIYRKKPPNKP